jgi:hypothetical protein
MKYNTFRIIRFSAITVFIVVIIIIFSQLICKKKSHNKLDQNNLQTNSITNEVQKIKYGSTVLPLSSEEKEIIQYQKSAITGPDVTKKGDSYQKTIVTSKYKLELRCDLKKGFNFWNRIKIDFNQNKNWDEKWTFSKDGYIKREVSPDDDEKYTYTYNLRGDHWLKK